MADNRITLTASMRNNLLSLQSTQKMMDITQERLSTGKKVNSALDNPSAYFTAQSLNTRANELESLLDGMGQAIQTITAADDSITTLQKLVDQGKALANNARDTNNTSSYITSSIDFKPLGAPTEIGGVDVDNTFSIRVGDAGEIKGTKHLTLTQDMGDMGMTATGTLSIKIGDNNFVKIKIETSDTIEAVTKKINENTRLKGTVTASVVDGKFILKSTDDKNAVTIQALSSTGVSPLSGGAGGNIATALGLDVGYTVEIKQAGHATIEGNTVAGMTGDTTASSLGISPTPAKIRVTVGENTTDIEINATTTITSALAAISAVGGIQSASIAANTITVGGDAGKAIKIEDISGNFASITGLKTADYVKPVTGGIEALVNTINGLGSNLSAEIDKNGHLKISVTNGESLVISDTVDSNNVLGTAASALGIAGLGDNGTNVRKEYSIQFNTIIDQIDQLVQNSDSGYKGINLLNGDSLVVNFNEARTSNLQIKGAVLDAKGLGMNESRNEWKTNSDIDRALSDIDTATARLETKASEFGQNLNIIQTREDFTENMINTLTTGADNLTLADMNEEAANMLSLQTRQQLGINALSLASQSQQSVLSLF